jgi:GNAT superfamily N-acetyltransferase
VTYTLFTLAERPDLMPQIDQHSLAAWPAFLLKGDMPHWHLIYETFAPFQLLLCDPDDTLLAHGHTVPLVWDGTLDDLPETIDGIIARAEQDRAAGRAPNTFSALAAVVAPEHQGQNLSRAILLEMKAQAQRHGCTSLIAPVRPTWKTRYPLTPMDRYQRWTRPDGAPFDPWLRVHWRMGAEFLKIAANTLTVEGTVAEWEQWTGMAFPDSGAYVVPGALQPVDIDREHDRGRAEDPGVWMRHPVAAAPAAPNNSF